MKSKQTSSFKFIVLSSLASAFCVWITINMNYTCVLPCKSSFSNRAWLSRHQKACTIYSTSQELKLEQRRAAAVVAQTMIQDSESEPRPHVRASSQARSSRPKISHSHLSNSKSQGQHTGNQPQAPGPGPSPQFLPHVSESHPPTAASPLIPEGQDSLPNSKATTTGRVSRQPRRFEDELPAHPIPIPIETAAIVARNITRRVILHVRDFFRSATNMFHILREYHHRPSYDPDSHIQPEDLANFPVDSATSEGSALVNEHRPPPWPFDSMSKYLLMNWFHSGSNQKSEGEVNRLVKEVINAPEFDPAELIGFNIRQGNRTLDEVHTKNHQERTPFSSGEWREVSVDIEIPVPIRNAVPKIFRVPGLYFRSITSVIRDTWSSTTSRRFHLTPFKRIHVNPSTGQKTRLYDEVYTSDAWIEAHDKLQKQPNDPGCKLEKVIAGLMFWSDSTHLTNFGTASVWPLYMYFANLSKYVRAQPNSGACHHIAYIPYVSSYEMLN